MATLHHSLLRQALPHSQFVTAIYAVLEAESLTLRLARAGHPYPVHIRRDGEIRELHANGGLLGIPDMDPDYEERPHVLAPGDKVLFYTDGIETLFVASRSPDGRQVEFASTLQEWSKLPAEGIVQAICTHLDHSEGSLNPADDVTLLALEVQS